MCIFDIVLDPLATQFLVRMMWCHNTFASPVAQLNTTIFVIRTCSMLNVHLIIFTIINIFNLQKCYIYMMIRGITCVCPLLDIAIRFFFCLFVNCAKGEVIIEKHKLKWSSYEHILWPRCSFCRHGLFNNAANKFHRPLVCRPHSAFHYYSPTPRTRFCLPLLFPLSLFFYSLFKYRNIVT